MISDIVTHNNDVKHHEHESSNNIVQSIAYANTDPQVIGSKPASAERMLLNLAVQNYLHISYFKANYK